MNGYILLLVIISIQIIIESIKDSKYTNYIPRYHKNKPIDTKLTLEQIKQELSPNVFEKNIFKSSFYFIRDFLMIFVVFKIFRGLNISNYIKLSLHAFIQGTFGMGLFILGHDCGHCGFSNNKMLSFIIGLICHSVCIIPYYPWRLSHKNHHKNTGDINNDEVYFPNEILPHNITKLIFGWLVYCYLGYGSRNEKALIDISNPLFKDDFYKCLISYLSIIGFIFIIIKYMGINLILQYYLPSIFITYVWIVYVTILHHMEETIVWKKDPKNINGIIESVDRNYGIFNNIIHNVGTHQVHHLCPQIPHYNLPKATYEFRKKFPELSKIADNHPIKDFLRLTKIQQRNKHLYEKNKNYKTFSYFDENNIKIDENNKK
jgi:omega-3 fatty acid desaturase (delta-15 desaturase)